MPGIFGFTFPSPPDQVDLLADMARRMKHHAWYREESRLMRSGTVGLGRVSLGAIQTDPQPAQNAEGTIAAVMDGEIYDADSVRAELQRAGCRLSGTSHAELLVHGYSLEGRDFFRRLDGKFSAAIWDDVAGRLVLVNDRFGMQPLYYARLDDRLLFGSEIKAVLADRDVPCEQNLRGLAQFFTFGQLLAEETLLEAVRVVPAAGWLVYDPASGELTVDCYWRLSEWATHETLSDDEWLRRIDEAFGRAVERRTGGTDNLGLALSGGLDARSLLAAIDHDRVSLQSVCLGVDGSLDHRSAARMAEMVGCRHHRFVLGEGFLSRFEEHLRTMVHLTDGHYLDQCIVLPTLPLYRELGIDVLLRGHAGELMHMNKAYNFSLDATAWAIRSEADLQTWLIKHLSAYMLDNVSGNLLCQASRDEVDTIARESLLGCLQDSAGVEPQLQRIWHLFVSQRVRRETAASLAMFGSVVETRVPFLDRDLTPLLMAAPAKLKVGARIQSHILGKRRPEFMQVANANTGTTPGAGALRQRIATFKMKALAKLGVKGYQHYERLGLWLRRELKGLVRDVLLDERCLGRGVFEPDTVRNVVHQHQEAGRNHTYLLMAMMIYEIGQREFVDGDPNAVKNAGRAAMMPGAA
jgi:asparagine synthase (glutamine-hydrolysing)